MILEKMQSHAPFWEWVINVRKEKHFPQALLLHGDYGIGKKALLVQAATLLTCRAGGSWPCGKCFACMQFKKEPQEAFRWIVTPGGKGGSAESKKDVMHMERVQDILQNPFRPYSQADGTIGVEQIREVLQTLVYKEDQLIPVLIPDADAMTTSAQNALLKTLEEVPETVCFILSSSNKDLLLPTIRSRCLPFTIAGLKEDDFLKIAGSTPQGNMWKWMGGAPGKWMQMQELGLDSLAKAADDFLEMRNAQGPFEYSQWLKAYEFLQDKEILLSFLEYISVQIADLRRLMCTPEERLELFEALNEGKMMTQANVKPNNVLLNLYIQFISMGAK
jgi:hypothetical protein